MNRRAALAAKVKALADQSDFLAAAAASEAQREQRVSEAMELLHHDLARYMAAQLDAVSNPPPPGSWWERALR